MEETIDEFDLQVHVVVRSPESKGPVTLGEVIDLLTAGQPVYVRRDGREIEITEVGASG